MDSVTIIPAPLRTTQFKADNLKPIIYFNFASLTSVSQLRALSQINFTTDRFVSIHWDFRQLVCTRELPVKLLISRIGLISFPNLKARYHNF